MGLLFIICYCHEFANKESSIRLMDLFSSFKKNFKNLPFNSLITGWSLENRLTYQVVHCHHDADFEEYALTYHGVLNQTLLVPTYRGHLPIHFTVWKLMALSTQ